MRCPRCGSFNDRDRLSCQCGFDLRAGPAEVEDAVRNAISEGERRAAFGVAVFSLGLGLSLAAYYGAVRSGVGPFVVFSGLTLSGLAIAVNGYFLSADAKRRLFER